MGINAWTTADELNWLRDMWRHKKLSVLKRYRDSLPGRVDWGVVKKEEVEAELNRLLGKRVTRRANVPATGNL